MNTLLTILQILVTAELPHLQTDDRLLVTTQEGCMRGTWSSGGEKIRVFRGIPFAEPPTGPRRWKPPIPKTPWSGIRDATEFGAACPQPSKQLGLDRWTLDEDCLFLNVWSGATEPSECRPVMVWIHGGGMIYGSGSQLLYEGTALAEAGVVLVTINYRLGPLGFLAHPLLSAESEHGVSGNYGLLDQIEALRWVQRNIAGFGGNPKNVTIFGESAGGVSVNWLLASPFAEGLFHRAILQSGTATVRSRPLRGDDETQDPLRPMESIGLEIERKLRVPPEGDRLAALRQKSPAALLDASDPKIGPLGSGVQFGPIVDGWFMPEPPLDRLRKGASASIPILVGTNQDDGSVFAALMPVKGRATFRLLLRVAAGPELLDRAEALYTGDQNDTKAQVEQALTDSAFVAPARMLARTHQGRVFLYHFTHEGRVMDRLDRGAPHGAEIPYVFGRMPAAGFSADDRQLSQLMKSTWVHFARTGDPQHDAIPKWPQYTPENDQHFEWTAEPRIGSRLRREACDFWDEVGATRQTRR